jgi:hypothetical protein
LRLAPGKNVRAYQKNNLSKKGTEGMTQVVEHLPRSGDPELKAHTGEKKKDKQCK